LLDGTDNFVSTKHVVSMDVRTKPNVSAYSAQVKALLTTEARGDLAVTTVRVDPESTRNTILDSGTDAQVVLDRTTNAFRATPSVEVSHTGGAQ
jgi:hypothetical protein